MVSFHSTRKFAKIQYSINGYFGILGNYHSVQKIRLLIPKYLPALFVDKKTKKHWLTSFGHASTWIQGMY